MQASAEAYCRMNKGTNLSTMGGGVDKVAEFGGFWGFLLATKLKIAPCLFPGFSLARLGPRQVCCTEQTYSSLQLLPKLASTDPLHLAFQPRTKVQRKREGVDVDLANYLGSCTYFHRASENEQFAPWDSLKQNGTDM
jgi:hypothetical protein